MADFLREAKRVQRYRTWLRNALNRVEVWIDGQKSHPTKESGWKKKARYYFRGKVFLWWLSFSFIYPLVLLLIEWAATGKSGLANNVPDAALEVRWAIAFGYFLYVALLYFLFKLNRVLSAFAVASAVAVAGGVAGAFLFGLDNPVLFYYLLFILVFPYVNCFFDYLSWGASRWLLRELADEKARWWDTLSHFFLDIGFALLCLFSSAFCLPWILEWASTSFFPGFSMQAYLDLAWNYPLTKGLGLTGMILSTFIPTLIHLGIAAVAFCMPVFIWREGLLDRFQKDADHPDLNPFINFADMLKMLGIIFIPIIAITGLVIILVWNIQFLKDIWLWFAGNLYDVAYVAIYLAGPKY